MSLRWSSATDQLYAVSNSSPSLDLDFASNKSLLDNISGFPLVNHQRDASSGKSAGTYVGSDGLIKTSPVNLLTYSEDFSPSWFAGTATVSAAPPVLSPTGTANTKELSVGTRYAPLYVVTAGNQYTFSIYVRSAGLSTQFALTSQGGFTGDRSTLFNIIDGTLVSSGSGVDNYSITSFPDGWYRVSQTDTAETSTNTTWEIESVNSSAYIWGAQLEEGPTVNTYVPTTNFPSGAPRFDHDPVTGESLGLLIEESRTNIVANSETFSDWGTSTTTKQSNAGTSPSGLNDALKIVADAVSGGKLFFRNLTATANNVVSIYAKAGEYTNIQIRELGSARFYVNFDLSSGTYVAPQPQSGSAGGLDFISADIQDAGNGWYRCSVVNSRVGAISFCVSGYPDSVNPGAGPPNFTGDGTSGVFVWGAQLEANASFPTSYIPTSGSTVTRSPDIASIEGTNFSSWFNTSEQQGTVFTEVAAKGISGIDAVFAIGSNNDIDRWLQQYFQAGAVYYEYEQGGLPAHPYTVGTFVKSAIGRSLGDNAVGLSGSIVQTDSYSGSYSPVFMKIGVSGDVNRRLNGHISRLAYYPYRLSDTILQEITS